MNEKKIHVYTYIVGKNIYRNCKKTQKTKNIDEKRERVDVYSELITNEVRKKKTYNPYKKYTIWRVSFLKENLYLFYHYVNMLYVNIHVYNIYSPPTIFVP